MIIHRTAILPFSAEQMFALVADVEAYQEFLNWCQSSSVVSFDGDTMLAKLDIAYGKLKMSFSTRNTLQPNTQISLSLDKGPFSDLNGDWQFQALGEAACKISLRMDFDFENAVTQKLLSRLFESIVVTQLSAFEQRAHELYS